MDNEADREARAIGGLAGVAQADIVQLGAQSEVRKKTDIHAAAETIGELVGRAAAGSGGGSSNQFAYSFGGGVDVGLLPHLALRPQLDYVGLRNSGQTANCTRLSVGFVVHF